MKTQNERLRYHSWQADLSFHTVKSKHVAQLKRTNQTKEDSRIAGTLLERYLSSKKSTLSHSSNGSVHGTNGHGSTVLNSEKDKKTVINSHRYQQNKSTYSRNRESTLTYTNTGQHFSCNGHFENPGYFSTSTVPSSYNSAPYMPKHAMVPPYTPQQSYVAPSYRPDQTNTLNSTVYNAFSYSVPPKEMVFSDHVFPNYANSCLSMPTGNNNMHSETGNTQHFWNNVYGSAQHYTPSYNNCPERTYSMITTHPHQQHHSLTNFSYPTDFQNFLPDETHLNAEQQQQSFRNCDASQSDLHHTLPAEMKAIVASANIDDLDL